MSKANTTTVGGKMREVLDALNAGGVLRQRAGSHTYRLVNHTPAYDVKRQTFVGLKSRGLLRETSRDSRYVFYGPRPSLTPPPASPPGDAETRDREERRAMTEKHEERGWGILRTTPAGRKAFIPVRHDGPTFAMSREAARESARIRRELRKASGNRYSVVRVLMAEI